jgi:hypothetical protein
MSIEADLDHAAACAEKWRAAYPSSAAREVDFRKVQALAGADKSDFAAMQFAASVRSGINLN